MSERKTKALSGLKIEDADQGTVSAVFATFDTVDHDDDVTVKGAFTDGQEVRISAYNHGSWGKALPVGKGTIRETDEGAVLDGKFFLNTQVGRDHFEVVKEMGELQEWSYGYDIEDAEPGEKDGQQVQILKKLKVHEVSPVLLGAGINTRTLGVKGLDPEAVEAIKRIADVGEAKQLQSNLLRALRDAARERWDDDDTYVRVDDIEFDEDWAVFYIDSDGDPIRLVRVAYTRSEDDVTLAEEEEEVEVTTGYKPKGRQQQKLSDHLATVLTAVKEVTDRLAEVKALRAAKGKALGEESADAAGDVADELESLTTKLREVLTSADDDEADGEKSIDLDTEAQLAEAAARLRI